MSTVNMEQAIFQFAFYEALSNEPKDFDHSCTYTFSK